MFTITAGRGFHMKLDNGWTVSVQWGSGNYAEGRINPMTNEYQSPTAEVYRWDAAGNKRVVVDPWGEDGDTMRENPRTYQTPAEVIAYINETATF